MRIMSAVHPSDNQKRVLAKIAAAPTPKVAGEEISKDANMVAARNMLMKLQVITFNNGEAEMTQSGVQISQDEDIIDQSGQLTKTGEALAFTSPQGQPDADTSGQAQDQQPPTQAPMDPTQQAGPQGSTAPMESFSLLKQLLR